MVGEAWAPLASVAVRVVLVVTLARRVVVVAQVVAVVMGAPEVWAASTSRVISGFTQAGSLGRFISECRLPDRP